jgi:HD-like signal output (HDOD) protein/ActR/RegA family two-component response regulator
MQPSILFVDDDANVLQGLRRMLHHKRAEWRMSFAGSGKEALALMAASPVDVLISDMRMPEIDGAALLAETARRHPDTIRFILSGQSSKESLFRAVGPCHQYLSKPCEGKVLEERVECALALRRRLAEPRLRSVIGGLDFLPSLPATYSALQAELEGGQARQERIEAVLARDPGLAAKLLQIANSAYFQRAREIRSVWQAVSFLGYDVVRTLALSFGIGTQFKLQKIGDVPIEELIGHGLAVGSVARAIARAEHLDAQTVEDCFSAGILHDLGILILADNFAERYTPVVDAVRHHKVTLHAVERAAFGVSHADVAAYLLGTWGLPDSLVRAVADHHEPTSGNERLDTASILRLADNLVVERELRATDGPPAQLENLAEDRRIAWRKLRDRVMEEQPA